MTPWPHSCEIFCSLQELWALWSWKYGWMQCLRVGFGSLFHHSLVVWLLKSDQTSLSLSVFICEFLSHRGFEWVIEVLLMKCLICYPDPSELHPHCPAECLGIRCSELFKGMNWYDKRSVCFWWVWVVCIVKTLSIKKTWPCPTHFPVSLLKFPIIVVLAAF